VATIDSSGLATALSAGTTFITASQGGVSQTRQLEVTDTVTIRKSTYNAKQQKLELEATSSVGGAVTLTAKALDLNDDLVGAVTMEYNSKRKRHEGIIRNLRSKPFRVEINSTGGGSASVQDGEIGGKGG
jgi:hypothetical protein